MWEFVGQPITDPDPNCNYLAQQATAEFQLLFPGCNMVPTEQDFGAGSRCAHWDEDCMIHELMTPSLSGPAQPLSRITIAALEDLGYTGVQYGPADPFTAGDLSPDCNLVAGCNRRRLGSHQSQSKRKLNIDEEARANAVAYGKNLLKERKVDQERNPTPGYVGDKIVSVIYRDGNGIHDVIVTADT